MKQNNKWASKNKGANKQVNEQIYELLNEK